MAEDALTPSQRSLRARIAVNESWAHTPDRAARTKNGRDKHLANFEDQVDPDHKLPADERLKRAKNARAAHMQRLALKASKARRRKKQKQNGDVNVVEAGSGTEPTSTVTDAHQVAADERSDSL